MPSKEIQRRKYAHRTIFGKISEKNVTFLVDISGSMYRTLGDIKEQLIMALTERAFADYDGMFNVIAFSDDVYSWASSVMPCTERTVAIAAEWIRNLESKASTNTQEALMLALKDPGTDSVYLVTDGLPDDHPSTILQNISKMLKGRPIHCFYISGSKNDNPALEFLRNLAYCSDGNVHLITLDGTGNIEDVEKVGELDSELSSISSYEPRKVWFEEALSYHPGKSTEELLHETKAYAWKPKSVGNGTHDGHFSGLAASLMIGRKVLARRDRDGYYYLGTVIQSSSSNTFRVEFDECPAIHSAIRQQETSLENMISYEDGLRYDIHVGEKVLAPLGDDGRYVPGTVVEGVDLRKRRSQGYECDSLIVSAFNGETIEIPSGTSVKISEELNDRIRNEILLPESLRKGYANDLVEKKVNGYKDSMTLVDQERKMRLLAENEKRHKRPDSYEEPLDHLKSKIERQIEEGEMLLQKLYLEDKDYARKLGYAPSENTETTYSEFENFKPTIDKDSFRTWRERTLADTFRSSPKPTKDAWVPTEEFVEKDLPEKDRKASKAKKGVKEEGYHKHRLELLNHWEKHKDTQKYSPYIKYGIPSPPSKPRTIERNDSEAMRPRKQKRIAFRTTTHKGYTVPRLKRRQLAESRPASKEYHTFDGAPFPPSTDRKFKQSDPYKESWTIDSAANVASQPINIITNRPIEYYANGNGPTHGRINGDFRDTKHEAFEKRERDLARNRTNKERILKDRDEFHRVSKEQREIERQERMRKYKEGEELNRQQRRAVRENFVLYQKEKEEKAQRYKQERLDAMKERRVNKDIHETNRERSAVEAKEKLLNGQATRETSRRKTFEASLDNEIKMQEKKLDRLRKIHASRLNKEDTRTHRAFKDRNFRDDVQDQTRQIYRASILP